MIGIFIAGPGWNERIWDGLTPLQFQDGVKAEHDINLWITPPEYTGVAEMVLQGSGNKTKKLEIPEGSQLKIRIHGGIGQPYLQIDQRQWAMDYAGDDNYTLDMIMPQGQNLKIKQLFMTRAAWNFELIPDHPPVIVLKEDALALPDGPVRFPLMIYDDYGAKTLTMTITLGEEIGEAPVLGKSANETRSVMSPPATEFEISPVYDLTAHPWAGLPAQFTFTVTDHKGQSTALLPVKMILPERNFRHPIAKALIAIRKDLIWSPLDDYAAFGQKLELLLNTPESFQSDIVTFLALRTAASRLYYADPSMETAEALVDLLWDTALRIEDGNLSLAARNLRDSQMELEKALQNPETSEKEISELMSALRNAMAEYLTELHEEMQKRMAEGEKPPMIPPELLENMIDPEALSQFLDELETHMRSGDKNAAQEMLSQLQRMMDMMDPSMSAPMPADMQMMSEGVNQLQELIDRQ